MTRRPRGSERPLHRRRTGGQITAEEITITGIEVTPLGRNRFLLSNDEVWEQMDQRPMTLQPDDRVQVRQRLLGAQYLGTPDQSKRSVKVRRIE